MNARDKPRTVGIPSSLYHLYENRQDVYFKPRIVPPELSILVPQPQVHNSYQKEQEKKKKKKDFFQSKIKIGCFLIQPF